jgi:hypothetical protein
VSRLFQGLLQQLPTAAEVNTLANQLLLTELSLFASLPTGSGTGSVLMDVQEAAFLLALHLETQPGFQPQAATGTAMQRVQTYYGDFGLAPDALEQLYAAALGAGVPDSVVVALIASQPVHQFEMAGLGG